MGFYFGYLKKPSGILKLFEILCVIIAFGLFRGSNTTFGNLDLDYFSGGVLVTALIVTPLLLVCYLMGRLEIQKTIFEVVFNMLMCVFLVIAGGVSVDKWTNIGGSHNKHVSQSLAMGSFCIIASCVYLVDTVFAVINYRA
ncbi:protein snakeskin [Procambarus clarkii]|uniref:protein snakeskin n=1 Tax=Procambarus clarkii TaxID=6728 RepID=UPI001E678410|nr:protein snakeskin-like [Procambarus clarkii]